MVMTGDNESINKNNNIGEISFILFLQDSDNRFLLEEKLVLVHHLQYLKNI